MVAFTRADNQALLNKYFGAGKYVAGNGAGEAALAQASPEIRAQYIADRQKFDGQAQYQPQYSSGVQTVGQVEPLNQWQKQAVTQGAAGYNNTSGLDFSNQLLQQAQGGITGAVAPMTGDQFTQGVNQYMNPYTQQVVDATNQQINKQAGIDQNNISAQFNQGSFGSSAHRIASQEMADNTARTIAAADAPLYSQGYTNAVSNTLNQFNQGQNAAVQGYSQFNPLANTALQGQQAGQNLFTMNLNNMLNGGNLVQQQNQNNLNATNTQLQKQQSYPQDQLNQLIAQLQNAYGSSTGATTSQPNMLQQLGGAGMVLGSNFNNLFGNSGYGSTGTTVNESNGLPWLK